MCKIFHAWFPLVNRLQNLSSQIKVLKENFPRHLRCRPFKFKQNWDALLAPHEMFQIWCLRQSVSQKTSCVLNCQQKSCNFHILIGATHYDLFHGMHFYVAYSFWPDIIVTKWSLFLSSSPQAEQSKVKQSSSVHFLCVPCAAAVEAVVAWKFADSLIDDLNQNK